MSAARIRHLQKAYGTHLVFDGLDLDVERGERIAVLGASGCGKSTLLRCIAGLERPDAGTIATSGEIGVVFQAQSIDIKLTAAENLLHQGHLYGLRGAALKARIAEKGFFMFRVNEDQVGGVELSDPQTPLAGAELKAKAK